MARAKKRRVLDATLKEFAAHFEIVGTGEHARRAIESLTRSSTVAA